MDWDIPWDPLDHPARIEVRRQESDDSDAEAGLGNVTRVVLRPPGHSGKAKRGHLCFDASYEGGNLGRVDFISEYEYDLFIRPDTCNPRFRMWFNFVVDNVRADQRVIFNLVNLCKIKTLFRDGMTPLVKTSSRPKWQRLPGKYVYYHKSPEHRNHYILSFAFAFDREEDVYQFAFSFPYSYSRFQAHLHLLEQRELPHFKRETIAASLQSRKLDVVTITNIQSGALVGGKRPKVIVILARTNPGETPTSYVAQGLMDFMVSSHPLATALRDHVIIKIVPMINPDGVFLGNYRTNLMGYDLNRHWNQVSPWSHPTLHAVKNFLIDLDASKTLELDMVIDLHAHSSLMGTFIYGNAYDDVYRFERHILFPKLFAHNAEDYNASHTMYNRDPTKAGTARRHLCEILRNTVNIYTLEVSYFGYTQPLSNSIITYNEDGYLRLGRNLARTFFEYYKATGIIPSTLLSSLNNTTTDENDRKIARGKGRRGGGRTRSRTKRKSQDRSPSNSKDIDGPSNSSNVNDNDKEDEAEEKETEKTTVLELAQLTKETLLSSGSSSDIDSSDEEEVKVKATRNGNIFQQQNIKRRSLTANPRLQQSRSQTHSHTNGSHSNVFNNHNGKGRNGKSQVELAKNPSLFGTVKKAAYQTFDFSILNEHYQPEVRGKEESVKPVIRSVVRKGDKSEKNGRKIGGGGMIGKRMERTKDASGDNKNLGGGSDTETEAPCLTIIDFNTLVRKALENQVERHQSQNHHRGWKGRSHRKPESKSKETGHLTDGGGTGTSGQPRSHPHRTRNNIRRQRAILLRGTVTDGSQWEDDGSTSSSDSSIFLSSLRQEVNMNARRRLRKRNATKPSSPSISPSPIFLVDE